MCKVEARAGEDKQIKCNIVGCRRVAATCTLNIYAAKGVDRCVKINKCRLCSIE